LFDLQIGHANASGKWSNVLDVFIWLISLSF